MPMMSNSRLKLSSVVEQPRARKSALKEKTWRKKIHMLILFVYKNDQNIASLCSYLFDKIKKKEIFQTPFDLTICQ